VEIVSKVSKYVTSANNGARRFFCCVQLMLATIHLFLYMLTTV